MYLFSFFFKSEGQEVQQALYYIKYNISLLLYCNEWGTVNKGFALSKTVELFEGKLCSFMTLFNHMFLGAPTQSWFHTKKFVYVCSWIGLLSLPYPLLSRTLSGGLDLIVASRMSSASSNRLSVCLTGNLNKYCTHQGYPLQ